MIKLKRTGRSVLDYPDAGQLDPQAVIDIDCDIWIPAARPDVIHADNVARLKAKLVVQGANIPCTLEAEQVLHERKVLVVPDFIANADRVICAVVEYHGGTHTMAFQIIEEKIRSNTLRVLEEVARTKILPRQAATTLAEHRVRSAMAYRRWHA